MKSMNHDYDMGPLEGDSASGVSGGSVINVRLLTGPGERTYVVICEYPAEMEERFGGCLAAITGTVEPNDYASTTRLIT